jgi:hypothetical protein
VSRDRAVPSPDCFTTQETPVAHLLADFLREGAADAIAAMVDVMGAVNSERLTGGEWAKVPGIPRLNIGSIVGGHGPEPDIAGAYDVADVCTILVDVRRGGLLHQGPCTECGRAEAILQPCPARVDTPEGLVHVEPCQPTVVEHDLTVHQNGLHGS